MLVATITPSATHTSTLSNKITVVVGSIRLEWRCLGTYGPKRWIALPTVFCRSSKTRLKTSRATRRSCFHYCTLHFHTGLQPGIIWDAIFLVSQVPFFVIRIPWSTHLQHSGTSTTFRDLFCYHSFCITLALFFNKIKPDHKTVLQFVKHFVGQSDRQISVPSNMSRIWWESNCIYPGMLTT